MAVADAAKYTCATVGEIVPFAPTYLFQSTTHKFDFTNNSSIAIPMKWHFENMKRKGGASSVRSAIRPGSRASTARAATASSIPCPFSIEPEDCVIAPNSTTSFSLKFLPLEVDDFAYMMRGETGSCVSSAAAAAAGSGSGSSESGIIVQIRGEAKRPICHFDIVETPDYMVSVLDI